MVVDEGVHVFDQDLHGRLGQQVRVVAFVHHVLQQQHEQDQHLLEPPRLCVEGDALQELRQPVAHAHAPQVWFFVLVAIDEVLKYFERLHLLHDL